MKRYIAIKAQIEGCGNACSAAYFSDTEKGVDLSPKEVCDLLNAYAGMKTREEVYELIKSFETGIPKDEYGKGIFRAHRIAYKSVLNKE